MDQILAISGSLREGSYNTALLSAAQQALPQSIRLVSIDEVPLYNGDVESNAMPGAVIRLKQQLADADGLLLASPEYNNSVPGVLKNTIDWLSRPSGEISNVFKDKPVAVIGAHEIWGRDKDRPLRGKVTVAFGRPIDFSAQFTDDVAADHARITEMLQEQVRALIDTHTTPR